VEGEVEAGGGGLSFLHEEVGEMLPHGNKGDDPAEGDEDGDLRSGWNRKMWKASMFTITGANIARLRGM
jgi:hypothetical protein